MSEKVTAEAVAVCASFRVGTLRHFPYLPRGFVVIFFSVSKWNCLNVRARYCVETSVITLCLLVLVCWVISVQANNTLVVTVFCLFLLQILWQHTFTDCTIIDTLEKGKLSSLLTYFRIIWSILIKHLDAKVSHLKYIQML